MDRLFAAVQSTSLIVVWAVILHRLFVALHHGLGPNSKAVKHETRLTWGVLFCFALALTFHFARPLLSSNLWWLAQVAFCITAIVGMMIWACLSCEFTPHLRVRCPWLLYGSSVAVLAYALIMVRAAQLEVSGDPLSYALKDTAHGLFCVVVLILALRIILPAHVFLYHQEEHPPMRLRLGVMVGTQAMIPILAISDLVDIGSPVVPALNYYPDLVNPLAGTVLITGFLIGHLLHIRYFVSLVLWTQHFWAYFDLLIKVPFLRIMECVACEWSGRAIRPVSWKDMLHSPDAVAYGSLVAAFDSRRLLKETDFIAAQQVGYQLDLLSKPGLAYNEVLEGLTNMGRAYTVPFLSQRFAIAAYVGPIIETPDYFATLGAWLLIHSLEWHLAGAKTDNLRSNTTPNEVLRCPAHAVYLSVMSVQNLYQEAATPNDHAASILRNQLSALFKSEMEYVDKVARLKQLGRPYLWRWLSKSVFSDREIME